MRSAVLAILLLTYSPAHASGGLYCDADDKLLSFSVQAGVTRGMGSPIFTLDGKIKIDAPGVPRELTTFAKEHVAQYWLDDKELKLVLYRERYEGPHAYVQLTIVTRGNEDGSYEGRYEVSAYDEPLGDDGLKLRGSVSCMVE